MPRLARKYLETSYCHVIVQGINREYIFKDDNLKDAYKNFLKKNLNEINVYILSYCIMDNHAHLLIYSNKPEEMAKLMHKTNCSYAKLYNKINNRVGYVYRGRYYVQPIIDESQLFNCVAYIHKNPVNANLVKRMQEYRYSSFNEFYGQKDLISDNSIKLLFGSNKNYHEIFKVIHKTETMDNIADISVQSNYQTVIENFIRKNNIKLENIPNNEKLFSTLLLQLRHDSKISLRDMSKIFNINKDRLNKIINKSLSE